jgi:hypothetical protein
MEIFVILAFVLLLGLTAARWGYDSRDGFRRQIKY